MSIRVGESWTTRDGHRRWVTMPLRDLVAGSVMLVLIIGPFWLLWKLALIEAWLAAEAVLFLVTGALIVAALARRQARPADVTLSRIRWGLMMLDVRGRP